MFYLSLWVGGSKEISYYLFSFHLNRPSRVNSLFQMSQLFCKVLFTTVFFFSDSTASIRIRLSIEQGFKQEITLESTILENIGLTLLCLFLSVWLLYILKALNLEI